MKLIFAALLCVMAAVPAAHAATAKRLDPKPATKREPKVTLDVKDAELRDVFQSLKKQCAVKNLILDPNVDGKTGSFFIKDIPCSAAFQLVLRMSGLEATIYENSVIHVGVPRR